MTRTQRELLIAGAILIAFAGGFGWQYVRVQELEEELEVARRDVAFTQLESTLAAAAVQAHRGDYEAARRLTSEFFTALQANIERAPTDTREELNAILAERDEIITLLSRADPQGRETLTSTFLRYRVSLGGPDRALPIPAGDEEVPTAEPTNAPSA